jgi:pimeloyl-ACP methyl ester carboxylesterase
LAPVTAALATALAIGCGADPSQEPPRALATELSAIRKIDNGPIRTIDHWVPHISTAVYVLDPTGKPLRPTGEHVKLFMREKIGRDLRVDGEGGNNGEGSGDRADRKARLPAVLFLPSATQPAVPLYDLPFTDGRGENYNWMTYLAEAGFDVFAMELTGYGLSPRPHMDDPCNALSSQNFASDLLAQQKLLKNPCTKSFPPPPYPYKFAIQSDWDEIDTVVDYIRELRGVDKVSLIGWSSGGPRVGGYAAQSRYAGKVEKLVLYSPSDYNRGGASGPPLALPERGTLMRLGTVAGFGANWARQLAVSRASPSCADPMPPQSKTGERIGDVIASGVLESDPVGSTWAKTPLNPPKNPLYPEDLINPNGHRVWRAPVQNTFWGWNGEAVKKIRAPTLIIRGLNDDQAIFEPQRDLFADLGGDQGREVVANGESDPDTESDQNGFRKVFVRVACAGHQLMFEKQHMRLLEASKEWLRDASYAGHHSGSFCVDTTVKGTRQVTRAPLDAGSCPVKAPEEDIPAD